MPKFAPTLEGALLTIPEAAIWLGVSTFTVRRFIGERRLIPIRLGRAVRIRRAELERLVDELAVAAAR